MAAWLISTKKHHTSLQSQTGARIRICVAFGCIHAAVELGTLLQALSLLPETVDNDAESAADCRSLLRLRVRADAGLGATATPALQQTAEAPAHVGLGRGGPLRRGRHRCEMILSDVNIVQGPRENGRSVTYIVVAGERRLSGARGRRLVFGPSNFKRVRGGLRFVVNFHNRLSSEIKDEICSKLASALRALKSRISRICGINELERRTQSH